ncbi:MAG: HD domain-containing protein [Armatimonadota bacterium]
MSTQDKILRDSVHGYIHVPVDFCREFIDTPIFQRLRYIEQTSMRCLFPSARHDRFIHSLGVYHLGKQAVHNLLNNSSDSLNQLGIKQDAVSNISRSFEMACLLHDCAHAPFSHTFEGYYKASILECELAQLMAPGYDVDYKNVAPATHELASALIAVRVYGEAIIRLGGDQELVARMIIGCSFKGERGKTPENQFSNALIALLNGKAIDVDKLDYIVRDTWASGVKNFAIDVDRLLSSVVLCRQKSNDRYIIGFTETAISVIQSVVDARNYLFKWIYAHHKVKYTNFLMEQSVSNMAKRLDKDTNPDECLAKVFNIQNLYNPMEVAGHKLYLVSDPDIVHFVKNTMEYTGDDPGYEWLTRQYQRIAIWKSKEAFYDIFSHPSLQQCLHMASQFFTVQQLLGITDTDLLMIDVKAKEIQIERNAIYVHINDKDVPYNELFSGNSTGILDEFFYVYKHRNCKIDDDSIVGALSDFKN